MIKIHWNKKFINNLIEKKKRETKRKPYFCFALKIFKEDACLVSSGRQFYDFTPLQEKHLYPFVVIFFGSCRSELVSLRANRWLSEFLIKSFDKYSGGRPLRALKTIEFISVSIKSWIAFSPRVFRGGQASASWRLPVSILAAWVWLNNTSIQCLQSMLR